MLDAKAFTDFNHMTQAAMESAKALEKINYSLTEELTRNNMALLDTAVKSSSELLGLLTQPTKVEKLLESQIKIASEFNGNYLNAMKENGEVLAASQNAYREWFEQGLANFSTTAKKPARKRAA